MKTKRDATPEETEAAIQYYGMIEDKTVEGVRARHEESVRDGYKAEVCECGIVYLANHHFTMCRIEDCPMRDGGQSLLDRMFSQGEDT